MHARFDDVRRMLRDAVGTVFPAAQLVLVDGGERRLEQAVGACTHETIFDAASLTKALVTTTLVMRHLDAGRLSLDDELRPGVTVGLALQHASGLPPWRPFFLQTEGADDAKRCIVEAARREPLEAPPGTRVAYSDLGFILLGDAVERAGGATLDAQWRAAGLSRAGYHPDPAACAETENGLRGLVHDDNCRAMGGVSGHAGLFATAGQVSDLAAALVAAWSWSPGDEGMHASDAGAAHPVRPATLRRFWSPSSVPGSTWCLGWDRPSPGESQAGARWPRSGVGHLGYTGCSLFIDPPRRRWVVLLSNRVNPTRTNDAIKRLRPALHDAIVAALDG
jgi:CubicO group peptidase (beta-lactamase class C family)